MLRRELDIGLRQISMATRKELLGAVITRYGMASSKEKARILEEFTAVTGYHRKHAIRLLNADAALAPSRTPRSRVYDSLPH